MDFRLKWFRPDPHKMDGKNGISRLEFRTAFLEAVGGT